MRNKMALLKNVVNLRTAYESLNTRPTATPGMALVHGQTGTGKTTAIAWLVNQVNGVFVRANAAWTRTSMLGKIMLELGAAPLQRGSSVMLDYIVGSLAASRRPLVVDEADYLFAEARMLDLLRDIHDFTGSAVLLVGMHDIATRLMHRPQLARRITQWIEFLPADFNDALMLANTVCETEVAPGLLSRLHEEAAGNVGLMVVGLARIESTTKANGWACADEDLWGRRPLLGSHTATNVVRLERRQG
jgi:hypothetical protein